VSGYSVCTKDIHGYCNKGTKLGMHITQLHAIILHDLMEFIFSDGLNSVSAVCTLMTVPVDNEMLANSVTFQAANMTARDLLEPATYDRLVES